MQNQDPLNPQSDQEFIAQLAQFSSLEQMTNLNSTMSNTSAYSLVGKEVIVQKKDSDGTTTEVRGTVDSVIMKNGHAQLTINGVNYDLDDLVEVMDDVYASQKYRPSVEAQTIKYDKNNPTMSTIEINLGSDGYQASSVAVAVNGEYINKDYLSYNDGKLTISPDAFKELSPGTYNLTFTFDDVYSTSVNDKVSVVVTDGTSEDNKTE